ncbi:DOMON domain-containing protein [Ditylenchus destructor]|uniref:Tyramine beta-hydroxylase n=1 Tax=Ditylenchus destructor TaxID=166010 RepID=A0AAD4N3L7_9BILA|nr:DOMON domain-containing protein [Ditylenchus destructor]
MMFILLFLFLLSEEASAWHTSKNRYPFMISTTLDDSTITLFWNVNWQKQRIDFKVFLAGNIKVNFLIGFSDHGQIENTDFCYYSQRTSRELHIGNMKDGWIDSKQMLRSDRHQDCILHRRKSKPADGLFYYSRKFLTCDPRDYAIEPGTTNILLAIGQKPMGNLNQSDVFYQMKYTQLLQEFVEDSVPVETPYAKTLDIRAKNIKVPAERTTYWCQSVELDSSVKHSKHHIIKYEPIITSGMEHIVHHMEVFHCQKPVSHFSDYCTNERAMPASKSTCSKVIAAWSMGVESVVYPPQAGMPIGGEGFVPFLMIEIHYDNYALRDNLTDSSGIRITYTKNLRQHDAGIMEVGLIYSDANSIPPQQSHFPITAHCPSDCTQKFPSEGINIFASQLHAHLTGKKLFTSHFRNGVKIGEINRDNHFSPHWQHIQPLAKHIRVLPGDVLSTTCVFDTKNRNFWTWGGYGIEDEMCVNYIHYYPATEVEVCKSAISNSTLRSFFEKMRVYKKGLGIHEMYSAVIPAGDEISKSESGKVKLLAEYYHVSPLNIACLDKAGTLLKHPSGMDWNKISRPETFAGIYTQKARSSDECFSTND